MLYFVNVLYNMKMSDQKAENQKFLRLREYRV